MDMYTDREESCVDTYGYRKQASPHKDLLGRQAAGYSRCNAASTNNCAISINCTTAITCLRLEPSRCSVQSYALTAADSSISQALLNASSVLRPAANAVRNA